MYVLVYKILYSCENKVFYIPLAALKIYDFYIFIFLAVYTGGINWRRNRLNLRLNFCNFILNYSNLFCKTKLILNIRFCLLHRCISDILKYVFDIKAFNTAFYNEWNGINTKNFKNIWKFCNNIILIKYYYR